ncbi:hypothetical protein [Streptomyces sp. NPDC007063]|uniref:hypothetical protein n=1 Tax=Streptomyces sp. NPDC007063 TaxID=3364772 RepID=UPI00369756BB
MNEHSEVPTKASRYEWKEDNFMAHHGGTDGLFKRDHEADMPDPQYVTEYRRMIERADRLGAGLRTLRESAERVAQASAGLNERLAADERRERFRTAVYQAIERGDDPADAAMSVADAETAQQVEELTNALEMKALWRGRYLSSVETYRDVTAEVSRLRADLETAKKRCVENGKEVCRKLNDVARLRAELESQRTEYRKVMAIAARHLTTIERVRAVLADNDGTCSAEQLTHELRTALGETDD